MMEQVNHYIFQIIISLLILQFQHTELCAQTNFEKDKFEYVDMHVADVSQQKILNPQQLAHKLTENMDNDFDKVRAFYMWISTNISYDMPAFIHNRQENQGIHSVLRSGKALCTGFSLLFNYLCEIEGIRSEIINGYAKGLGYTKNDVFDRSNHAWNAVFIHGDWYLLDVTWAAGNPNYLSESKSKINPNIFFLTDPEVFIQTHLPEDPSWQLLDVKISISEFETSKKEDPNSFSGSINSFSPNDYTNLNEFDKDILSYKRASSFNQKNESLIEQLAFAYIYKGISITERIPELDFMLLKVAIDSISTEFYTYLDSANLISESLKNSSLTKTQKIIQEELNYQKGIFNYELGTEFFINSDQKNISIDSANEQVEKLFEVAETYFSQVPATSIYFEDASNYLKNISDFRKRESGQLTPSKFFLH